MFRRTTISVFLTATPRMVADMVTVITGLDRILTAGAEGATAGEGMAGEDVAGIETEVIYQDQRLRMTAMFKVKSSPFGLFR